jgi:ribosome-binding protein aMBF1 (putative translation factor)
MQLTPEQREQVESAKAAGERRVVLEFTPEQRADWEAARDAALAEKEEVIARLHGMRSAEADETFSGRLRLAITASKRSPVALADEIGIDPQLLSAFRCGDVTLPSDVIDRLIAALGLRLMQEIPASNSPSSNRP